jgi:hypothetical protein
MANYTLSRSSITGYWHWACDDGSDQGWCSSRREARQNARTACSSGYVITPTLINATYDNGFLSHFSAVNLDGKVVKFSVGDIREELFNFFFGIINEDEFEDIDEADRFVAILKIFGIYFKGGVEKADLLIRYNLTNSQFLKIIEKDFDGVEVEIDDLDYNWTFPE